MKSSFSISELEFRGDSQAELIRTRRIFETLRNKAKENKKLSEHEKEFFCHGLVLSLHNDGKLEDFKCCDNRKFKFLYLVYYHDLSGASPAYKPNKLLLRLTEVTDEEKRQDLKFLYEKSAEWKIIVNKLNHNKILLQEAAKEARNELINNRDSLSGTSNDFISNTNFSNEEIERQILLKSKYIYCTGLKLFEKISKEGLFLKINEQIIEINEYSMIHILNRHFAAKSIYYNNRVGR